MSGKKGCSGGTRPNNGRIKNGPFKYSRFMFDYSLTTKQLAEILKCNEIQIINASNTETISDKNIRVLEEYAKVSLKKYQTFI